MKTPILETERILLRPLSVDDAKHIYHSWTSDAEVVKYMVYDIHESVEDTIEWLEAEEQDIDSEQHYIWGFVLKENNLLFGSGGVLYNQDNIFELAYNIMKKYWSMGLTTEACRGILKFAKEELKEKKVACHHAKENIASQRVIEKLGFVYQRDSFYTKFSGNKTFSSREYLLNL